MFVFLRDRVAKIWNDSSWRVALLIATISQSKINDFRWSSCPFMLYLMFCTRSMYASVMFYRFRENMLISPWS